MILDCSFARTNTYTQCCFGLAAGEPATEPWMPRVILWDQRLVLVIAIELLQCWQRLNYVAYHKPQISQSTHVDPTTDSECQNRAMKQPGKRTHLMNDVLFYITRKATCMRVCCLPREEMEAGYTMGTEPASEASKVLPWNLGPLLWSGCCFHTWDARSFTAVAFAHFQTTLEKKNTQQGFEEHGKECGLQIPLISFQIDVMKNQISMETWFKPLKESAANRLEPDPTAHLTPGQYYYYC